MYHAVTVSILYAVLYFICVRSTAVCLCVQHMDTSGLIQTHVYEVFFHVLLLYNRTKGTHIKKNKK